MFMFSWFIKTEYNHMIHKTANARNWLFSFVHYLWKLFELYEMRAVCLECKTMNQQWIISWHFVCIFLEVAFFISFANFILIYWFVCNWNDILLWCLSMTHAFAYSRKLCICETVELIINSLTFAFSRFYARFHGVFISIMLPLPHLWFLSA